MSDWQEFIDEVEAKLDAMTEDDRNDAIEALRSRFEEIYTRRLYGSWPDDSPIKV